VATVDNIAYGLADTMVGDHGALEIVIGEESKPAGRVIRIAECVLNFEMIAPAA
jgi:hypothetical protein